MMYVFPEGLIFVPVHSSHHSSAIYTSLQKRRSLYLARCGTNAQDEIFFFFD